MEIRKLMIIWNLFAGNRKGEKHFPLMQEWFKDLQKKGVDIDVRFTGDGKHGAKNASELALMASEKNCDVITAVGGDGTICGVADGIIKSQNPNIAVHVIPTGRGNDFAKASFIPVNMIEAQSLIVHGEIRKVDVLRVNEKICCNFFSIGGIDVKTAAYVEKKKYGFLPRNLIYLIGLMRELSRLKIDYPYLKLEVLDSGKPVMFMEGESSIFTVMNGSTYGAIFKMAPHADLEDGLMDVCWIRKAGRLKLLTSINRAIHGNHLSLPEVFTNPDGKLPKFSSLIVSSQEPLPASIDGEIISPEREFKVDVIPRALKLFVPPSRIAVQTPLLVENAKTPGMEFA